MASEHETLFADTLDVLADHFGDSVSYYRSSSSVVLTVTPSTRLYRIVDSEGLPTSVQSEDFQFLTTDLVIGGVEVAPQIGDRIKRTVGSQVRVYEVLPLGDKPCYERRVSETLTIAHTKFVGVE
jgi:hypothetical protein